MSLITGGRSNRFLQKYFGIKGEVTAPELGPEIHPVVQVTNLPLEHRILDSIQSYWCDSGQITGAVGAPATVAIRNPPLSNVQMVVKRLLAWYTPTSLPDWLIVGPITAGTAPTRFGQSRDSRARGVAGAARSTCGVTTFTDLAAQGGFNNFPIGQPVTGMQLHIPFDCGEGFVVNPGEQVLIQTHNNAEKLAVTLFWIERAYEPSELSLT